MSAPSGYQRPGITGSGVIACGIAACATTVGDVRLLARSDASAWKAEESAQSAASKLDDGDPSRVKVTTDPGDLTDCDLLLEAVVEDTVVKTEQLKLLSEICAGADLATTTSSLSISELGVAAGCADRLLALHFFNPPHRMELVEVCLPDTLRDGAAKRALGWLDALGKTAVEVPDIRGFVVNRLVFPYLFDAVRLLEETGMEASDVDDCMRLGAGHPMGPLALLDFIGLDVAVAIGESLHDESGDPGHEAPPRLRELVAEERLGRKSDAGFYDY